MPVELTCQRCGKVFSVPTSRADKAKYCSVSCSARRQIPHDQEAYVERVCKGCGGAFEVPRRRSGQSYCSFECRKKRVTLTCEHCGTSYTRRASAQKSSRFCSTGCHDNWRSEQARIAVAGRTEKPCTRCGETKQLADFRRKSTAADGRNSWCKKCDKEARKKWLERKREEGGHHECLTHRRCSRCEEVKPVSEFGWRDKQAGILRSACNACTTDRMARYYERNGEAVRRRVAEYREANRDEINRRKMARYYARHKAIRARRAERLRVLKQDPELYAKHLASQRAYYRANRGRISAQNALYRRRNRERYRAYHKRHYRENRGRYAVYSLNRLARKKGAGGSYSWRDVVRIWHHQRGECARCGNGFGKKPEDRGFHVDHITPLSRGGSNWPRNLQLLCEGCNCSKGAKTPAEYTLYLRRLEEEESTSAATPRGDC